MLKIIMALIAAITLIGCGEQKPEVTLTAEDLATAQGMHWWLLEIPSGMEKNIVGIGVKRGNEKIIEGGGATFNHPGLYKVFIWDIEKESFHYAIFPATAGKGNMTSGEMGNPLRKEQEDWSKISQAGISTVYLPNGSKIKLNDTIVKSAPSGQPMEGLPSPVVKNEIGICITVNTGK